MTIDKALATLFAMANVQDGYAKKATDPGLKVIHKANAKAQREVAATIKDLRARLASTTAERSGALAEVQRLQEAQSEHAGSLIRMNDEAIALVKEAEAERDAALARVEKLRAMLRKAANRLDWCAVQLDDEAMSQSTIWADEARAALDEDARHG